MSHLQHIPCKHPILLPVFRYIGEYSKIEPHDPFTIIIVCKYHNPRLQ